MVKKGYNQTPRNYCLLSNDGSSVLFNQNCEVVGHNPKENLAKFGYMLKREVHKLGIMLYVGDMLDPTI
jgi:hypothetical protein